MLADLQLQTANGGRTSVNPLRLWVEEVRPIEENTSLLRRIPWRSHYNDSYHDIPSATRSFVIAELFVLIKITFYESYTNLQAV